MSAIPHAPPGPVPTTKATSSRPLWLTGLIAGVAAAVLHLGIALVATAADFSLEVPNGKPIPVLAFPQLTLVFSAIGLGPAAVLSRRARQPRRNFVVTTIALTLLSFVAPPLLDADRATVITPSSWLPRLRPLWSSRGSLRGRLFRTAQRVSALDEGDPRVANKTYWPSTARLSTPTCT
jgi:hypothetical protein